MRFHYPLQKIVDLKNTQKTQAEWMLSQALGALNREQQSLHELHSEKESTQASICEASLERTTIHEIRNLQHYVNHLEQQIVRKHQDVLDAQMTVVTKQEHLTDRMVDEKIWNKAKEKALQKFWALALKKDQEELDEMAAVRHPQPS